MAETFACWNCQTPVELEDDEQECPICGTRLVCDVEDCRRHRYGIMTSKCQGHDNEAQNRRENDGG